MLCSRQLQCKVPCWLCHQFLLVLLVFHGGGSGSWGGLGVGVRGRGQGTFQPPCHVLHYHMVLRPKGTSHNEGVREQKSHLFFNFFSSTDNSATNLESTISVFSISLLHLIQRIEVFRGSTKTQNESDWQNLLWVRCREAELPNLCSCWWYSRRTDFLGQLVQKCLDKFCKTKQIWSNIFVESLVLFQCVLGRISDANLHLVLQPSFPARLCARMSQIPPTEPACISQEAGCPEAVFAHRFRANTTCTLILWPEVSKWTGTYRANDPRTGMTLKLSLGVRPLANWRDLTPSNLCAREILWGRGLATDLPIRVFGSGGSIRCVRNRLHFCVQRWVVRQLGRHFCGSNFVRRGG